MPTNIVRPSGVIVTPVTSHLFGEVRKRRVSPVFGSAHTIMFAPMLTKSPEPSPIWSVCTHRRPK
jgi:hypothetical protein